MIEQRDFDQLLTQAKVKLVGASDAGLRGEFYDVLTEFFNDSSIWTQEVTIPYLPNVRAYPAFVPEGQIIRLNWLADWGPNQPLPLTQAIVPGTAGPVPAPALMSEIGLVQVAKVPDTSGFYQAQFVCNTALPTGRDMVPHAPSWVLPIWHVGLLDGILGKMMTSPNKSYSNQATGQYHLKRFRDAIARARVSKLRANTVGSSAWRFPQNFRALSQQSGVPAIGSSNERSF